MGSVSLPVNVFCWLGWKQPSTTARRRRHLDTVAELRPRGGSGEPAPASTRATASYANPPSTTITRTSRQERRAPAPGRAGRCRAPPASACWRAAPPHRGGDVRVAQLEAVVGGHRRGLVGESRAEHGREQPVARAIAGEHPTGAVGAVSRRRQPDDQDAGLRIAEAGHREAPVVLRAERSPLVPGDLLAPVDQAAGTPTVDDLRGEGTERVAIPAGHVRTSSASSVAGSASSAR